MNPLGILLAFAFLGSLVLLGIVLTGLGVWRLRGQIHHSVLTGAEITAASLNSLLIILGLLFAFYGIAGTYRVIWGT